ncbi:MAG: hypothetical protein RL334_1347 [Chloroflexota bacterium]
MQSSRLRIGSAPCRLVLPGCCKPGLWYRLARILRFLQGFCMIWETRICTCRKWGRCEMPQWMLRALHLNLRWHLRRTTPRPAGAR